ncbi:PREDICTED: sulfate [Prunus dulcis]|uniref:PREDICTED: sulfate n=1 Tax=Prunus dulcis TaxID=3755 RepID=A0A5E4EFA5_PRUDU|nr:PREDICTED: sulfate [Prunus dulcis]
MPQTLTGGIVSSTQDTETHSRALLVVIDYEAAIHLWKVDKFDFVVCKNAYIGFVFGSFEIGLVLAVRIIIVWDDDEESHATATCGDMSCFHPRDGSIVAFHHHLHSEEVTRKLEGHAKKVTSLASTNTLKVLVSSRADAYWKLQLLSDTASSLM